MTSPALLYCPLHDIQLQTENGHTTVASVLGNLHTDFGLSIRVFTATCFSNVAVMGSLDVRPSVCPSVRDVGEQ